MDGVHICTTESLMAGAIEIESSCPVCFYEGKMRLGYIGVACPKCGKVTSSDSANLTVRYRRELLKMGREEMARLCGVYHSTVAHYENWWPSESYWEQTRRLVQEYSKEPTP